jgi:integrase
LNLAVAEYADAHKLLPPGASLREAVTDFARRTNTVRESRTVPQLVVEYIAAKEKAGRSEAHLRDIRLRLTRFGGVFQLPVAHVTGKMLQSWLDGLTVSNRTKLNELRLASGLLNFAVRRKYAPRDLLDELEAVERPEVTPSPTLIFTPAELLELSASAPASLIPWLIFGGFCGLRSAEILRLDWRDVNLKRRFVEVRADNAKTAQRRLVPLCDAAVAWLQPRAQNEGHVVVRSGDHGVYYDLTAAVNRTRIAAGTKTKFKWKRNGLRHSFCSYRLAITQDAAKTSLEAGNSPQMIFRHYRELTTEDEAKEWFSILPPKQAGNGVPLQIAANARCPRRTQRTAENLTILSKARFTP